MKYLPPEKFPNFFCCPNCKASIHWKRLNNHKQLVCKRCKKHFPFNHQIIRFVDLEKLDEETKRELKGNSTPLTKETISYLTSKNSWGKCYRHFDDVKISILSQWLRSIKSKGVISLGSGSGLELLQILKHFYIPTIFSSDLSFKRTCLVPQTLKEFDGELCLFTSNIIAPPIISNPDYPVIIYEAIHHTGDMTHTIEILLSKRFKHILFVEPITNFLVKILVKFGLAQRVEYSGLKPKFLDLKKLYRISRKYGYRLKIKTIWEIPDDYFNIICKKNLFIESLLLSVIDTISVIGNIFKFGSFAVVWLEKID